MDSSPFLRSSVNRIPVVASLSAGAGGEASYRKRERGRRGQDSVSLFVVGGAGLAAVAVAAGRERSGVRGRRVVPAPHTD